MASSITVVWESSSSLRLYPRTAGEHANLEVLVGGSIAMEQKTLIRPGLDPAKCPLGTAEAVQLLAHGLDAGPGEEGMLER